MNAYTVGKNGDYGSCSGATTLVEGIVPIVEVVLTELPSVLTS